jgi:chromosome segregation ATPase
MAGVPPGSRHHRRLTLVCHAFNFARYAYSRAPASHAAMSISTSIETLREALAPVEALRGEHSQLESWVRESFTAMDALHGELSDWQRDLTRQQAQLDQREAALQEGTQACESEAVARLEQELSQSRDETRQLEEENAEQLQALEELDRQLALVKAELRLVTKHADERAASLDAERERADEERRQWTGELREMRRVLERLAELPAAPDGVETAGSLSDEDPADEPAVGARAAELRRRANSRRAAQQQRRPS